MLVKKLLITKSICAAIIIDIKFAPKAISAEVNLSTDNMRITSLEKIITKMLIKMKNKTLIFIIADATSHAFFSLLALSSVKTGIKTVDSAPTITTVDKRLGILSAT